MGEHNVGGSAVVNQAQGDDDFGDEKSISPTKIANLAKAYAWLLAKDAVMLTILKVC
jgi:nucleolar MIF4G domain-containing protein 1